MPIPIPMRVGSQVALCRVVDLGLRDLAEEA